jgi:REP element-mobilizing transposase RayT
VFSTKDRKPYFDASDNERLNAYFGGMIRNMKAKIHIVNSTADHIHLAAGLHPDTSLSSFIRTIKTNSSKWIHDTFESLEKFSWQEGYSAFSVSYSGIDKVIQYIATQQEHHKKLSFEEELLLLLQKHNIEYDPRYVFK